jgi:hypothetical protein
MIISASRRTDIPAFYSRWLINRLRAGFCLVPNPFNPGQVARVELGADNVEAIVFWTRNPRPLYPFLDELDGRGYRYYFQYTLLDYPRIIDQHTPPATAALETFRRLADRLGPQRLIWRYDPIVLSEITPPDFHRQTYTRLAEALRGSTTRSVISLLDRYPKIAGRLGQMEREGAPLLSWNEPPLPKEMPIHEQWAPAEIPDWLAGLLRDLSQIALANEMEMVSCAEPLDLRPYGIRPGKCVDDDLIFQVFGLQVSPTKDPGQRPACGCAVSKDIGMYDTCLFGCRYCYATGSFERAHRNYRRHDPDSPWLVEPVYHR